MRKYLMVAALMVAVAVGMAAPASAVNTLLTATDLNDASVQGDLVTQIGTSTDTWVGFFGGTNGTLDNEVWVDSTGTLYTYIHTVAPASALGYDTFVTVFDVLGFDGSGTTTLVGWDYTDTAGLDGGTGSTAFKAFQDDVDGTIDWAYQGPAGCCGTKAWDSTVTFFFQSTNPPTTGNYGLIDGGIWGATSFAPTPEPATLLLLGSGLAGVGFVRRWFKR